jgi:2-methylisocitrate lyase-like PEP mutase family enzyme
MTSLAGLSPLLASGGDRPFVAGGSHDPVSARVIEYVGGFDALYVTGFGLAASQLGLPDMGFMDRSDFISGLERIRRVTQLPMIVDAEDGYGNADQIFWTFRELARIGIAAAHIEDLKDPLKYRDDVAEDNKDRSIRSRLEIGESGVLFTEREMAGRIRAALEGAEGRVEVVARCDAQRFGTGRVIELLNGYVDAGATICMVAEPYDLDELQQVASGIEVPLLCCVGVRRDHQAHAHTLAELSKVGVAGALFTATTFFAGVRAMVEVAALVSDQGNLSVAKMGELLAGFDEINAILDAPGWYSVSERLAEDMP